MKTQRNKTDLLIGLALILVALLFAGPAYGEKLVDKIRSLRENQTARQAAPAPARIPSAPPQRIQVPSPAPVPSQPPQRIQTPPPSAPNQSGGGFVLRQFIERQRTATAARQAQPPAPAPVSPPQIAAPNMTVRPPQQAVSQPAAQTNPNPPTTSTPRINSFFERLTARKNSVTSGSQVQPTRGETGRGTSLGSVPGGVQSTPAGTASASRIGGSSDSPSVITRENSPVLRRLSRNDNTVSKPTQTQAALSANAQAPPTVSQQQNAGTVDQRVSTRNSLIERIADIRNRSSAAGQQSSSATSSATSTNPDNSKSADNTSSAPEVAVSSGAKQPASNPEPATAKRNTLIDRLVERKKTIQTQKAGTTTPNQAAPVEPEKTASEQVATQGQNIVADKANRPTAGASTSTGQQKNPLLERIRQRKDTLASDKQKQPAIANTNTTEVKTSGSDAAASSEASQVLTGWPKLRQLIEQKKAKATQERVAEKAQPAVQPSVTAKQPQEDRSLGARIRNLVEHRQKKVVNDNVINDVASQRRADKHLPTATRLDRVVYHDRPERIEHAQHPVYTYLDHNARMCHRIIWPDFHYVVRYSYGPQCLFSYVHPFYHRKYVFVSLGGYWPIDYTYVRYYWYGWHPYTWYGYYPIPQEVPTGTYNYYTYNYYYDAEQGGYAGGSAAAEQYQSSQTTTDNYMRPVDQNTFADVRERLAKQAAKTPAPKTEADTLFEEAVKAFEAEDYSTAVQQLSQAAELAPQDVVLPFAYSQALFANQQYAQAAEALRGALLKVSPCRKASPSGDKEGVFYPRGLYANDDVLFEHIQRLLDKVELYNNDADLQLLLGYHLLGIGETDYAVEPLQQASHDMKNADAAKVLLYVLEKIKAANQASNVSGGTATMENAQE